MMNNSKMSTKQTDSPPHQDTDNLTQPSHSFSFTNSITIVTYNIRGATNLLKLQNWIEHCSENNLHIIALTETKLTDSNSFLSNPSIPSFLQILHHMQATKEHQAWALYL